MPVAPHASFSTCLSLSSIDLRLVFPLPCQCSLAAQEGSIEKSREGKGNESVSRGHTTGIPRATHQKEQANRQPGRQPTTPTGRGATEKRREIDPRKKSKSEGRETEKRRKEMKESRSVTSPEKKRKEKETTKE